MRIWLIAIIIAVLLVISAPILVYAIADPDSPPQVNGVYIYEDLQETGDAGALIDYTLDYGTVPNETATEAFMAVFVDTDGSTQLKSVAPYTYQNSGYRRGLIWIYFSATEVATYGIDSANETLYDIWLIGNPTLSWAGDPPKTIATIDYWQPESSSAATLLALRVLSLADTLELAWSLDLIEETALGNRLTTLGESYFTNVIPNLMEMAPSAFGAGEQDPTTEDIDYSTIFGATMTNGTGNVIGSPVTLTEGNNTVTVNETGTFTLTLSRGTSGNISDNTGVVTGSPVDLVYGINTITVTSIGTLTAIVNKVDTESRATDTVSGTAFDLTTIAARFGMSRWMFSGLVWLLISIVVCAGTYRVSEERGTYSSNVGSSKIVMLVFNLCIIGGIVLGLVHPLVGALLFIAFGALTGYVLFFKGAYF